MTATKPNNMDEYIAGFPKDTQKTLKQVRETIKKEAPGTKIVKFRVKENVGKAETKKNLKTCSKGHKFYKSSDCPTCPICEQERKPQDGFLALISAPARRALENKGITTLDQLSKFSEREILELHGMG